MSKKTMSQLHHPCPCGCGQLVPTAKLACHKGWVQLPIQHRKAITSAYGVRPMEHARAVSKALAWFKQRREAEQS